MQEGGRKVHGYIVVDKRVLSVLLECKQLRAKITDGVVRGTAGVNAVHVLLNPVFTVSAGWKNLVGNSFLINWITLRNDMYSVNTSRMRMNSMEMTVRLSADGTWLFDGLINAHFQANHCDTTRRTPVFMLPVYSVDDVAMCPFCSVATSYVRMVDFCSVHEALPDQSALLQFPYLENSWVESSTVDRIRRAYAMRVMAQTGSVRIPTVGDSCTKCSTGAIEWFAGTEVCTNATCKYRPLIDPA